MEGNYNRTGKRLLYESNYTLERDGRELQQMNIFYSLILDYTLERDTEYS